LVKRLVKTRAHHFNQHIAYRNYFRTGQALPPSGGFGRPGVAHPRLSCLIVSQFRNAVNPDSRSHARSGGFLAVQVDRLDRQAGAAHVIK
jgi:hypothetical protein